MIRDRGSRTYTARVAIASQYIELWMRGRGNLRKADLSLRASHGDDALVLRVVICRQRKDLSEDAGSIDGGRGDSMDRGEK